jgi:hypothetical protein
MSKLVEKLEGNGRDLYRGHCFFRVWCGMMNLRQNKIAQPTPDMVISYHAEAQNAMAT